MYETETSVYAQLAKVDSLELHTDLCVRVYPWSRCQALDDEDNGARGRFDRVDRLLVTGSSQVNT